MSLENQLRGVLKRLDHRLPLVVRWFKGENQPPVGVQEITFWEDEGEGNAKILMRRADITYVFESFAAGAGSFVAESRTLTGGVAIAVIGDLSADRTINFDLTELTADGSPASGDYLVTYDVSAGAHKKILLSALITALSLAEQPEVRVDAVSGWPSGSYYGQRKIFSNGTTHAHYLWSKGTAGDQWLWLAESA
jgi:hypothetical protein